MFFDNPNRKKGFIVAHIVMAVILLLAYFLYSFAGIGSIDLVFSIVVLMFILFAWESYDKNKNLKDALLYIIAAFIMAVSIIQF